MYTTSRRRTQSTDPVADMVEQIQTEYESLKQNIEAIRAEGDVLDGSLVPDTNGKGYNHYRFIPRGTGRGRRKRVYVSNEKYPYLAAEVARGDRIRELQKDFVSWTEEMLQDIKREVYKE